MEQSAEARHLLFTGIPGCGKSTLIERIARSLDVPSTGFFTREIREEGRRTGFSVETLSGQQGMLAHRHIPGPYRVGAYGVDIEAFERVALPSMKSGEADIVVVVDEIGKMECFSMMFQKALLCVLDSDNRLLGTIAAKGNAFIEGIKRRKDVALLWLTERNREVLVEEGLEFFRKSSG